ncbi:MAG: hypothetical protein J5666_05640 [Bacilli bacterium]|nr:hypothetical protein [Bacilli bacterium]
MYQSLLTSVANSSSQEGGTSGGSLQSIKKLFTNPILYVVLGCIVLLIIVVYLIRRFVTAKDNTTVIIVRHGKIYKVLNKDNPKYFRVPFMDSIGAIITDGEKSFSSDKLFINNGPDALYKINYTLKYKINDPKEFYKYLNKIQNLLPEKLNDELRLYADQGNALVLVKDYRENTDKILEVINNAVAEYHISVTEFKINIIEPMGK